jgi:hypothetical protein
MCLKLAAFLALAKCLLVGQSFAVRLIVVQGMIFFPLSLCNKFYFIKNIAL